MNTSDSGEERVRDFGAYPAPDGNGHTATANQPLAEELRRSRREVRELGQEAGSILGEVRELMFREGALARAEMQDQVSLVRSAGMFGGVAAIFLSLTLVFLSLAGMFALALVWPLWLSALVTAGVLLLIGAIAGWMVRSRMKKISPTPKRTISSLQEDARWAREQMKRNAG